MKPTPKEFALQQIAPYFKDPSICGYEEDSCKNITSTGKMCVAGKNYLPEIREKYKSAPVSSISDLFRNDQSKVFLPESVDILTWKEWSDLQSMHDAIARKWEGSLKCAIKDLNLFTYEELVEYSSKL